MAVASGGLSVVGHGAVKVLQGFIVGDAWFC